MMLNKGQKGVNNILTPILIFFAVYGVIYTTCAFIINRSLRLDEAMFAQTIITRDFYGLLSGDFDYGQSGALGYIFVVKVLIGLFGSSEIVLRLISFLSYIFSILCGVILMKCVFKINKSYVTFLLLAGLYPFVFYATDFKPYSLDVFLAFLSILLYHSYLDNKKTFLTISICYSIMIWFSFGSVFMIAGINIYHFYVKLFRVLNKKGINRDFIYDCLPLLILLISVMIDYFLWVKPTSANVPGEANEYWKFLAFPIIPTGVEDLKLIILMFLDLFVMPIGLLGFSIIFPSFVFGIFLNRRLWVTHILTITVILVIIASSIGMYPISLRLQLFLFGFYIIFASLGIEYIIRNIVCNQITIALILVILVLPILVSTRHNIFNKESVYVKNEECKSLIKYYNKIKSDNTYLYVSSIAQPQCAYYLNYPIIFNYHNEHIVEKDHVIWGSTYRIMHNKKAFVFNYEKDKSALKDNIDAILRHQTVFLVRVHDEEIVYDWLVDELKKFGDISVAYEFCGSILYKFEKNI